MNTYLATIENENTRKAMAVLGKYLESYCRAEDKTISTLDSNDIDKFLKLNYSNVSESSLYSRICALKKILTYFHNEEAFQHLNIEYVKENFKPVKDTLYTPYEIVNKIESLLNAQDRCIVLLCYIGLYDTDFKTIRNLKENDLIGNKLRLPDGNFLTLNSYCLDIVREAIAEVTYTPYSPNNMGQYVEKELNYSTNNIIKSIHSSRAKETVSAIFIKKRFATFADYLQDTNFTPIAVKNSKIVYDFVRKEYFENNKAEIAQPLLIEYCKERNIVGCVEQLNSIKKQIRQSIIEEIEDDLDFICR